MIFLWQFSHIHAAQYPVQIVSKAKERVILSQQPDNIAPHGGQLINRMASAEQQQEFLSKADFLPRVQLDERAFSDLELIAIGGFSPLSGFMEQTDYLGVVKDMHLANGLPWSIPVTLSVSAEVAAPLKEGNLVRLDDVTGRFVGVLELTQKYEYDKTLEAINVYRTDEEKHPGVKVVYNQGAINLAGCYNAIPIPFSRPIKSIRRRRGPCSAKRAGRRWWVSKRATRFTVPTNIFKSVRWKPWMACSCTRWWAQPRKMTSRQMFGCAVMKFCWSITTLAIA
jgi:hypothetical protein